MSRPSHRGDFEVGHAVQLEPLGDERRSYSGHVVSHTTKYRLEVRNGDRVVWRTGDLDESSVSSQETHGYAREEKARLEHANDKLGYPPIELTLHLVAFELTTIRHSNREVATS